MSQNELDGHEQVCQGTCTPMGEIERVHGKDFKPKAYEQYTMAELGMFVHLLTLRAGHRTNPEKRAKDLYDAENYLAMMKDKLDAAKAQ